MEVSHLKPLIHWLQMHPHWGILFTFIIALGESIAVIGLVVPGSVIMSAIGILVGSNILPLIPTLIAAILGAFIGDVLSYGFGHHYKQHMREMWPFRKVPTWIQRGENFFSEHGGKSIFVGRFIGPIRPILPLIAGSLSMYFLRFAIVDFISAVFWAPAYMFPGYLFGAASQFLAPEVASQLIIEVLVILVFIWLIFWFFKLILFKIIKWIDRIFLKLWYFIQKRPVFAPLCRLLQATHIPDDHSQFTLAISFLISSFLFIVLTIGVIKHDVLTALNAPLFHFFRSIYQPNVAHFMIGVSLIASPIGFVALWIVLCLWLAFRREWHTAIHWLVLGCLSIGAAGFLKRVIASARPYAIINPPSGWSYPSGHVTLSVAFLGMLAFLLSQNTKQATRWFIYTFYIVLISMIALSRIYLSVHWFTDLLGGTLLASAILFVILISYRRTHPQPLKKSGLIIVTCAVFALAAAVQFHFSYQNTLKAYQPKWPSYLLNFDSWWQEGFLGRPVYRDNRFGKPVEVMNVEWVGDIDEIQKTLTAHGWVHKTQKPIINTIKYLSSKDRSKELSPIPVVYQDQNPAIIMTKQISPNAPLLVLHLWPSQVSFFEVDDPMWVGTIGFHLSEKNNLPNHLQSTGNFKLFRMAANFLIADLGPYRWKKIHYSNLLLANSKADLNWQGFVLLIKPSNE